MPSAPGEDHPSAPGALRKIFTPGCYIFPVGFVLLYRTNISPAPGAKITPTPGGKLQNY